jgi:hypothetical protein
MPLDQSEYNRSYYARNRERIRAHYEANREARLAYGREYKLVYRKSLKDQIFEAYGGCCACCEESNPAFLSIDHVNGGGRAHRQSLNGGTMLYLDIIRRGFPDEFQLLCYNCNLGRAYNGGVCPHKDDRAA